ncbi:hypothetical protein AVEN_151258-1 [Araneus ventricosus]|uniref:Uncharacterized protein n=1 Tax=Araneus ventricosus TaxID=182803 RepID=A0A4Y2RE92_ARAVE|nr:hypothetical protein AVEN_254802-1 [Araneus ventricosus]GBN73756.1 hypothetical protein AVEN_151258-1 [Araneus ventricosus]
MTSKLKCNTQAPPRDDKLSCNIFNATLQDIGLTHPKQRTHEFPMHMSYSLYYREQRERSPDYQKLCAPTNHTLWKWRPSAARSAMDGLQSGEPPP